ncbi:hypothetical protein EI94DRAFT_1706993 [Lactarius quietus]|nr:hypothetical protein EI94DRAFT_1706993 [Lactarius quietus]
MSAPPQMSTPLSSFKSILDEALSEYKKNTGMELLDQPLASEVQHCDTVAAVLTILQDQAKAFQQFEDGDQRLMKWIGPSVQVLFAFSGTLGMGDHAGLAAKDVKASHHALVELFERIEKFFKPLGDYIRISLTTEMAEVFVKITAKVISVLSIATKEVGRWRASEGFLWYSTNDISF